MDSVEVLGRNDTRIGTQRLETLMASIVEVTRQRERNKLEDSFGRVIGHLTGAKSLIIYHLRPKDGDVFVVPDLHLANGVDVSPRAKVRPFLLSSNAPLAHCLRKARAAHNRDVVEQTENELILPLQSIKGEISAFCKIENACNDADTRRMLPLLLEFYTNFVSLVDDNERDMLTGLLNRKTFDRRISKILAALQTQNNRATDKSAPVKFCLAALDIDHFKHVNDTFGHLYGDEVLLLFANLMKETFRENDLLFRFGGEEFVSLLCNTDIANAHIALERFRSAVENYEFPRVGKITVSIGVALISPDELPRTTMDRADKALYFAKQNGRNQMHAYEDLAAQGLLVEQKIQIGEIELF